MSPGKERRRFKRHRTESKFRISIGENSFQAYTTDFSLLGFGFIIEDTPNIPTGSIVNLKIEDLNLDIDGKIAWSYKIDSQVRVGIDRFSISGSLTYYLFSDLLLDLQRSEKEGVLEIKNNSISKRIYIKNGDIIFATSNREGDRLGELLLKSGKISLDHYYRSINILKKTGKRLGTVLVELGYLKPEDLIWAVRHQVEEIILDLFQWEIGEFVFIEGILSSKEVITLKLSAANLIYKGIKKINNLIHIKNALPPLDTLLFYSTDPIDLYQDINLDKTDKEILSLIDGKRTIKKILSLSQINNFQTLKTLYALLSIRLIELKEDELSEDETLKEIIQEHDTEIDSEFIDKVETMYKNLKSKDFYSILGIVKIAEHDKIKQAYHKVAKEFHPDKHFHVSSETFKNRLNTIFSHITEAYRILSDPIMRRQYDQTLSIKPAKVESNNTEISRFRFSEGKEAFWNGSFSKAAELFGQAAYLDSSVSDYHFYMGLALEKLNRLRGAEKALNHALKIDPFNPEYIAELGHIYLKLGFKLRAKSNFEKAVKFDPSNKRATEGLRKIRNHS
jgi:curved DNA-binding protein CbpA